MCLGRPRPRAMPIQRVPGMTLVQTVQRQVKMKEAPVTASVGFRMIRADLEEDSDVEVARAAVTDAVKDVRTRANRATTSRIRDTGRAITSRTESTDEVKTGRATKSGI
jgi:hypothetical protein